MNIGKMAVQITANAQPLIKGMDAVSNSVTQTASKTATALARMSSAATRAADITIASAKRIATTLKAAGLGAVRAGSGALMSAPLPIVAAGAAIGGLGLIFDRGANALLETDSTARQLGVTVGDLRAAMLLAGPAASAMQAGLGTLAGTLADLRAGGIDAERTIAGIQAVGGVGFNARGGTLDALRGIAENLSRIQDPAVRAAQAYRLFGAAAGELLPYLAQGAAGVDRARSLAARLGLGASEADLASVRAAARVMGELKALGSGLFNQVLLGIAPVVAELGRLFDLVRANFSGIRDMVIDVAQSIAQAGAFVVEAWSDTSLIADGWRGVFSLIRADMLRLRDEMLRWELPGWMRLGGRLSLNAVPGGGLIGALHGLTGNRPGQSEADRLSEEGRRLLASVMDRFRGTQARGAVDDFFRRVRQRIAETGQALRDNNPAQFYMDMLSRFNGMAQQLRNPMETFQQTMNDLMNMSRLGLFAGQPNDLMARMAAQALATMQGSVALPQFRAPAAAEFGSREAYSAALNYDRSTQHLSPLERIKALQEEHLQVARAQERTGRELLWYFARPGPVGRAVDF